MTILLDRGTGASALKEDSQPHTSHSQWHTNSWFAAVEVLMTNLQVSWQVLHDVLSASSCWIASFILAPVSSIIIFIDLWMSIICYKRGKFVKEEMMSHLIHEQGIFNKRQKCTQIYIHLIRERCFAIL